MAERLGIKGHDPQSSPGYGRTKAAPWQSHQDRPRSKPSERLRPELLGAAAGNWIVVTASSAMFGPRASRSAPSLYEARQEAQTRDEFLEFSGYIWTP